MIPLLRRSASVTRERPVMKLSMGNSGVRSSGVPTPWLRQSARCSSSWSDLMFHLIKCLTMHWSWGFWCFYVLAFGILNMILEKSLPVMKSGVWLIPWSLYLEDIHAALTLLRCLVLLMGPCPVLFYRSRNSFWCWRSNQGPSLSWLNLLNSSRWRI